MTAQPVPATASGESAWRRAAWAFGLIGALLLLVLWPLDEPWRTRAARRLARGTALRPADFVALWLWWGIAGNAALCLLLAATARWWHRWTALPRPAEGTQPEPATRPPSRWFLAPLGAILLVAALARIPLLDEPMRRDESDTAVRNVHGVTLASENGTRAFQEADWVRTLWEDGGANNPVLFSILSHAGLELWRALTGAA